MSSAIPPSSRRAYTLIEIIVSVALMMILMLIVTQLFSIVGGSITNANSVLSMLSDLRNAKNRLSSDLSMQTADPSKAPPVRLGSNEGYFCLIEGMGAAYSNQQLIANRIITTQEIAKNPDSTDLGYDNTVGDTDDILMFTATAPPGEPFRGRLNNPNYPNGIVESSTAEIVWFVRGTTLYRRVLLIVPDNQLVDRAPNGFYTRNDISAHYDPNSGGMVANTLDDLTIREHRFGHGNWDGVPPFQPPRHGVVHNGIHANSAVYFLRLPTLGECAYSNWDASKSFAANIIAAGLNTIPRNSWDVAPALVYTPNPLQDSSLFPPIDPNNFDPPPPPPPPPHNLPSLGPFIDFWMKPLPWNEVNQITGDLQLNGNTALARTGEDVILKNVLSFDVQVWAPELNRYVNLGEDPSMNVTFMGQGRYDLNKTLLPSQGVLPCVYDTWTDFYEIGRRGTNQIDDTGNGIIDDIEEWECPPPYSEPLRGLKVTIRVFDPDSKVVREMVLIHSFVR